VCASTAANSASACQDTACHSLLSVGVCASPPGPVKAERRRARASGREPEGSLDGWRRCQRMSLEGMAGMDVGYAALF
jgi:hypothetical protein